MSRVMQGKSRWRAPASFIWLIVRIAAGPAPDTGEAAPLGAAPRQAPYRSSIDLPK